MLLHLPAVQAHKRDAHLMILRLAETELGRVSSKIGGLPYMLTNEKWPVCPDCRRPMMFMFQINFADLPPGTFRIGDWNLLSFHYCLSCAPESSLEGKGYHLELRETKRGEPLQSPTFALHDPDTPEPRECSLAFRPIEDLPPVEMMASLVGRDPQAIEEYSQYVEHVRGGRLDASKVGGYPHWLQSPPAFHCQCGTPMRFLAQIPTILKAHVFWNAGGTLYLFYCPQACDAESLAFAIQAE